MPAPAGIDYSWAIQTGGVLTSAQKRALFTPLVQTVLKYPGLRARLVLGRRGHGGFDLDTLRLPDSRLARDAQEMAHESIPSFLVNHSYRVFLFGTALARLDGISIDDEAVFVASMLHDLHLGDPAPGGRCFAVAGGERAEAFAVAHDVSPERARRIGAEVSGHVTVGGYDDLSGEGGFVGAGAVLDLLGLRLDELRKDFVDAVLAQQPRDGFKRDIAATWKTESRAVPDGRAAWLRRYAMMLTLVRIAPMQ
ncbi:phosphohydrolase [Williamsia serinedens]|uniref:HD domain-containing protein n=1 Tax=Williamsia serinedens TaxID=391736 RepID=A0ABT1GXE4_9NOCA|nr:phosphohydrolase [Williamsia serinedens]MCP2159414.1 hypothetical protein [Williamsia serinedens]